MGVMVAVEGLDGAGKATLVAALAAGAGARGATVTTVGFPRYDADVHAELAREALHGELGDVRDSVHAMALLFALDRRGAAGDLRRARDRHDLLLVDRYVASNAAYGAARLGQDAAGPFVDWVRATEVDRFALPVPDRHVLVRVPGEVAAERVRARARADADREPDGYEADAALQARCAGLYDELVARQWLAPWATVDTSTTPAAPGRPSALTRTVDELLDAWHPTGFAPGSSVRSDTIET